MLNKTKLFLYVAAIAAIIGIGVISKSTYSKFIAMSGEISAYRNNQRAYEDIVAKKDSNMRVLRLSVDDLRHSNDKLILDIDSVRKSLKRPKNKPGDVSTGTVTVIHDTDTTYISNPDSFKLDTLVKFNELTKVGIKIQKSKLISTIDVNNTCYLYVYSLREFVNSYANGWIRFWKFDWKKETVYRYDIKNSNKLVQVTDSRVYINDKKIE